MDSALSLPSSADPHFDQTVPPDQAAYAQSPSISGAAGRPDAVEIAEMSPLSKLMAVRPVLKERSTDDVPDTVVVALLLAFTPTALGC